LQLPEWATRKLESFFQLSQTCQIPKQQTRPRPTNGLLRRAAGKIVENRQRKGRGAVGSLVSKNKLPFLHSGTHFSEEMSPARFIGWFILQRTVFVGELFLDF
jgi:hypothetical protein